MLIIDVTQQTNVPGSGGRGGLAVTMIAIMTGAAWLSPAEARDVVDPLEYMLKVLGAGPAEKL